MEQALDFTTQAARTFGIGVATIRRSHHIACLAAYLTWAAFNDRLSLEALELEDFLPTSAGGPPPG